MEEQLREDQQELKTREHKKKAKGAKMIRWIGHKNKGTSHVQDERGNSNTTMSRHCSVRGKGGIGMTPKVDGFNLGCAPSQDVRSRRRTMYTRVAREACLLETGKAPIKTGWAETDKGQPGKPKVGREGIQDAREARVLRVDAAAGGADSSVVGDRHACGIG